MTCDHQWTKPKPNVWLCEKCRKMQNFEPRKVPRPEPKRGEAWRRGYEQGIAEGKAEIEKLGSEIEEILVDEILICHEENTPIDEIVDEILICREENTPTSRLTSAFSKIAKLFK